MRKDARRLHEKTIRHGTELSWRRAAGHLRRAVNTENAAALQRAAAA